MINKTREFMREKMKKIRSQHPNVEILTKPIFAKFVNMAPGSDISFDVPETAEFFRISAANFVFFSNTQKPTYPLVGGEVIESDTQICTIVPREIQAITTKNSMFYVYNPQATSVHVMVEFWDESI